MKKAPLKKELRKLSKDEIPIKTKVKEDTNVRFKTKVKDNKIKSKLASSVKQKVKRDFKSVKISSSLAAILKQEKPVSLDTAVGVIDQPVHSASLNKYNLPLKYKDNRIVLMARDPWWIYTYWDISETKIEEVIGAISPEDKLGLRWALRVYDVTGASDFNGFNAVSFFDLDINFEAGNWYINVNQPQREWCVDIGFKNAQGKFFVVLRSNIIVTPYFGISSRIDEEWALDDEEYLKLFGIYDLGRSSLERKRKIEESLREQISSHFGSAQVSSFFSKEQKDKFFLEVATELILYGRTEADARLTVEGKRVQLRKDGTFTLRYALPEGDFKFEVIGVSKNRKHTIKKTPAVKRYNK